MVNLVYGTISLSEGLSNVSQFLNCTVEEIENHIIGIHFPAFIAMNDFSLEQSELQNILKDLFSSSYFPKEWSYTVLELLEWIRNYNWLISKRNNDYPFKKIESSKYDHLAPIRAQSINPMNPPNTFLVLDTISKDGKHYVDVNGGKVISKTNFPTDNAPSRVDRDGISHSY